MVGRGMRLPTELSGYLFFNKKTGHPGYSFICIRLFKQMFQFLPQIHVKIIYTELVKYLILQMWTIKR